MQVFLDPWIKAGSVKKVNQLVNFFNASGFDPRVKKYLHACSESIEEMVDENIKRFWQVDTRLDGDALIELSQTLETAKGLRERLPNWAIWTQTLSVLELYFDQKYSTALKTFEGSQLTDFRLRYMLALLLHKSKRYEESIALIRSLGAPNERIRAMLSSYRLLLCSSRASMYRNRKSVS